MWVTSKKLAESDGNNASVKIACTGIGAGVAGGSFKYGSTLESCIAIQRRHIYKNRNTASLRKELKQLQQETVTFTGRHQIRLLLDVKKEIAALETLIALRESGEEERLFEERVKPYEETYSTPSALVSVPTKSRGIKRGLAVSNSSVRLIPTKQPRLSVKFDDRKEYDQSSIQDEFLNEFEKCPPPLYVIQGDICEKCTTIMIMMGNDAMLGCPSCGLTRIYIQATSSRIAYGEEVEFSSFSYKRLNHFLEWLATFQAKESTVVPIEVVQQVMEQLHARHVTPDKITQKKVREVLKTLKSRKSYDHVPQITARITGKLPPRMTPYQEEQMTLMFQAIQAPFEMHRPFYRRNFLSYAYCLYKFCELCGWDQFLRCFALLKGRDKLRKQDIIFQKICKELDWEFLPSI